jgi:hypothetical protein
MESRHAGAESKVVKPRIGDTPRSALAVLVMAAVLSSVWTWIALPVAAGFVIGRRTQRRQAAVFLLCCCCCVRSSLAFSFGYPASISMKLQPGRCDMLTVHRAVVSER